MSSSTANLELLIQLRNEAQGEIDKLTGGLRGVGEEANNTQGKTSGFFGNMMATAGGFLAANVIGGIGSQIGDLAGQMVSGNAEWERYQTQFGVLLGSADAAKQRLADLADFGAKTPFELPEVVRADKILTAFGLDAQDTQQRFGVSAAQIRTTIGDVASGVGVSFEDMSNVMGRFSSGATGEAIARMQEMGVATKEQMASWGMEFSKSGQLLTPAREAFTILEAHLRDKFGGMMDAQSKTFEGMASNLEDWKGQTIRTIGAPIFEVLKDKLGDLMGFLSSPAVQQGIKRFADLLANGIGDAIDWLTKTGVPAFQRGIQIVGQVIDVVRPYVEMLINALRGVGSESGDTAGFLTTAWNKIKGIIDAVVPPIRSIITTVFGAVQTFLQAHGAEIQQFIGGAWKQIQDIILLVLDVYKAVVPPVLKAIAGFLQAHGADIQRVLGGAWDVVKGLIQTALDLIQGILRVALAILRGDWSGAWEEVKNVAAKVWTDIQTVIGGEVTILETTLGGAWERIKTGAVAAWNGIKDGIVGAFNGMVEGIRGILNSAIDLINRAVDVMNKVPGVNIGHIGHVSTGAMSFAGGLAWVGEAGPELMYVPTGSRIWSNSESDGMGRGGDTLVFQFPMPASAYDERRVEAATMRGLARMGRRADTIRRTRG